MCAPTIERERERERREREIEEREKRKPVVLPQKLQSRNTRRLNYLNLDIYNGSEVMNSV